MAYLQTDKGKDHYNNLFPNHNDQCVHLKASKFLGVYLSSRKGGKWAELCEKLGISEHYKLNKIKKNVGNNVKTAQKHLSQHADIVAQTLPPQQPPTSTNNNVSNLSLSFSLVVSRCEHFSPPNSLLFFLDLCSHRRCSCSGRNCRQQCICCRTTSKSSQRKQRR